MVGRCGFIITVVSTESCSSHVGAVHGMLWQKEKDSLPIPAFQRLSSKPVSEAVCPQSIPDPPVKPRATFFFFFFISIKFVLMTGGKKELESWQNRKHGKEPVFWVLRSFDWHSQLPYFDPTSLDRLTVTSVDMNVSHAPSEISSSKGLWIGFSPHIVLLLWLVFLPSHCLFANLRGPDYWHLRHALLP